MKLRRLVIGGTAISVTILYEIWKVVGFPW